MKKSTLISRLLKNVITFGALFIVMSIVVDWYRKPSAPPQFAEQVLHDTFEQPKVIAQLSYAQPMVLYFWGSWCGFCQVSTPAVQALQEQGVPVLGVALQSGEAAEVNRYLQEKGYTFATINDPQGDFSRAWDIQATPSILIIKDGKIINHTTGFTTAWGLKLRVWLAKFA